MIFTISDTSQLKIGDCENIYSVNPLYLTICKVDGHIKKKNRNKCLVFNSKELHSTDENKRILKSTQNFGMGLKMKMKQ